MTDSKTLEQLLDYLTNVSRTLFNAPYCQLALVDSWGVLSCYSTTPANAEDQTLSAFMIQAFVERTIVMGEAPAHHATADSTALCAALCVPFIAHDDVLGVLYLERNTSAFTVQERDRLSYLVDHAAVQMQNWVYPAHQRDQPLDKAQPDEVGMHMALNQLANNLLQSTTLNEMVQFVLDCACELTHSAWGEVGYVDPQTRRMITITTAQTATPLERVLVVPALMGDQAVGQIVLGDADHTYNEHDKLVIDCMASLYTSAVQRYWAQEAERTHRLFAEALRDTMTTINQTLDLAEVFDRILTNLKHIVPYDAANLMRLEDADKDDPDNTAKLRVACCQGYKERGLKEWLLSLRVPINERPFLARALQTRQPYIVLDTQAEADWQPVAEDAWIRSYVSSPICYGEHVLGFLNLCAEKPNFFVDTHAEHLRAFADQAAVAIQNAELYAAERRERILAQTFQQVAETLSVSNRLEDTVRLVLDLLGNITDFDYAAVLMVDGDHLRVVASRSRSTAYELLVTDQHESFAYVNIPAFYKAMSTGEPVVLENAQQDARWAQTSFDGATTRGWIGVPLIVWDVVLGLLSISSQRPNMYSQRDVKSVSAFARQVALAIENSHLYTQLETSQADLRQARAHLTQTARLSVAGKIAAGVAHQINNPLTSVIAQTHLLLKRLPPESTEYQAVDAIRRATYRAGTVVQRLLDFSRPSTYTMQPLDLNRSILNAIALIRAQIEPHIAQIVVHLAADLPLIQASETHLEDVWINLILNARDAVDTNKDSIIRVSTYLVAEQRVIKIVVADNGLGIASENLPHIFDPLFTTREYGTGLGLSICHDVIMDHGGMIQANSRMGRGATFTITLPVQNRITS